MKITETGDEKPSLTGQELGDVNTAVSSRSTSFKSKEVDRQWQYKTQTEPLTKHLELLCDLLKNFPQAPSDVAKKLIAWPKAL